MWLGGAEGCGQWRMHLAISGAGGLELTQALSAVRLVLVDGGDDTLEILVAVIADREEELAAISASGLMQAGQGIASGTTEVPMIVVTRWGLVAASRSPSPTKRRRIIERYGRALLRLD